MPTVKPAITSFQIKDDNQPKYRYMQQASLEPIGESQRFKPPCMAGHLPNLLLAENRSAAPVRALKCNFIYNVKLNKYCTC